LNDERQLAAYEELVRDMEKLLALIEESQQNQHAFMEEAYRLLQEQGHDVEMIRYRAQSAESVLGKMAEMMKNLEGFDGLPESVHVNITGLPDGSTVAWPGKVAGTPSQSVTPGMMPGVGPSSPSVSTGMMPGMSPGMSPHSPSVTPGMLPGVGPSSPSMTPGMTPEQPAPAPHVTAPPTGTMPPKPYVPAPPGMYPVQPPSLSPGAGGVPRESASQAIAPALNESFSAASATVSPRESGSQIFPAAVKESLSAASATVVPRESASQAIAPALNESFSAASATVSPRESGSQIFPAAVKESLSIAMATVVPRESGSQIYPAAVKESVSATASATIAARESTSQTVATAAVTESLSALLVPAEREESAARPHATTDAQIRVLHASPDAPNVDVYIDGKRFASDVAYEGVSPYLTVPAGKHRLQVFPAGKQSGALIDSTIQLKPEQHYTIAVAGDLRNIRPLVIPDAQKGAKPGFSRLKIVHLSPDAPGVDVTLPSGKVLIGHLTFRKISPYLQVTPGTRDLQLRRAGTQEVLLQVPRIKFDPNVTYTLYIIGRVGGEPKLESLFLPEA
jgi:hypothetical protein